MSDTENQVVEDTLPPRELEIILDPPVEYKGGMYGSLRLREPKAVEVRRAEGQLKPSVTMEAMRNRDIWLVHLVSGLPLVIIEQLPISKLNEAAAYLDRFIEAGRGTGKI